MNTIKIKREYHYPKVDAKYPVVVLTADGAMRGETKHISTQQAFVRCKDPLRLYDVASMSIKFSEEEAILAEGEVIWSNRYGPDDEITPVAWWFASPFVRQRTQAVTRHYCQTVQKEDGPLVIFKGGGSRFALSWDLIEPSVQDIRAVKGS